MKALVVGGTGFFGLNLVRALRDAGWDVAATRRRSSNTIFLRRLGVPMLAATLEDEASLTAAMRDREVVFFAAGHYPRYSVNTVPAPLWGSSYVEQTPLTPSPDLVKRGRRKPPPPPPPSAGEPSRGGSSSTILLVLFLLVLVTVGLFFVLRSGLPSLPALIPAAPPPTTTQPLPTAAVLPTSPPETPGAQGTPGQALGGSCLRWEEVTLAAAGQTLCVYGDLKRWFAAEEIPFVALFSEVRGSFAIVDRTGIHYEAQPGSCITATGEVEVMGGTRPFIDADGELLTCP